MYEPTYELGPNWLDTVDAKNSLVRITTTAAGPTAGTLRPIPTSAASPEPFYGGGYLDNCTIPYVPLTSPTSTSWSRLQSPFGTTVTVASPRRIRLTLAEVEALHEAARGNDQVKAALQKVAPHIEVQVDFG